MAGAGVECNFIADKVSLAIPTYLQGDGSFREHAYAILTSLTDWKNLTKTLTSVAALIVALGLATDALAVDIPNVLHAGSSIMPGQMMVSANGIYELHMQADDGNLVLRKRQPSGVTEYSGWNTGRKGGGTYGLMQTDSNFVLYPAGQTTNARWPANGGNQPYDASYRLVLGVDGSIKIYNGQATVVQTIYEDNCSEGFGVRYNYPVCTAGGQTIILARCGHEAAYKAFQAGGTLCGSDQIQ